MKEPPSLDTSAIGAPPTARVGYIPQLDGLRAFAVLSVLVSHYIRGNLGVFGLLNWGRFGVVHFFVISGFLITTILLNNREKSGEKSAIKRTIIKNFYVRRFLRILPIYYLTVLALFAVGYDPIVKNIGHLLVYTPNISMGFLDGVYGLSAHFWSLAVEEQFYLLYPALVLFVPKRQFPVFLWSLVAFSLIYKVVGTSVGISWKGTNWNLPGCFDSLGLGGLLAHYCFVQRRRPQSLRRLTTAGLWIGIPLFVGVHGSRLLGAAGSSQDDIAYRALVDLSITLPSVWLIARTIDRRSWWFGHVLSNRALRFIGKTSYGVYVYHNFARLVPVGGGPFMQALVWTVLTLVIATLSWRLIEAPINGLKRRAPYLGERTPPDSVPLPNTQTLQA